MSALEPLSEALRWFECARLPPTRAPGLGRVAARGFVTVFCAVALYGVMPSIGRGVSFCRWPSIGVDHDWRSRRNFLHLKLRDFGRILDRGPWPSATRGGRSWQSRS